MKRTATLIVVAVLVAPLVQAQNVSETSDHYWTAVVEQNIKLLDSGDRNIQHIALKNIIILSNVRRDKVSFERAVPTVIALCDRDQKLRSIGFAALQSIGSREALAYLDGHEVGALPSEVIASVLKEYFDGKSTASR